MAERITEQQVEELQNLLASDAAIEAKVAKVTAVKTGIKHHNVPDECVAPLFEALRKAARNQHANLVNAGLTSLNHLLTRLSRQDPRYISQEKTATVKLFVEKMGDQKEKFRLLAIQSLVTMCKVEGAKEDVEKAVKEIMEGKNVKAKAKEASLQWLLLAHVEAGLPFKTYVPLLMRLLENGDPGVRDAAKHTVIELLRNAPGTAKADVKKKLKEFGVRPAIEAAILKELIPRATTPAPDADTPEPAPLPIRPVFAASVSSVSTDVRPITPMPDTRTDTIEPSYINTKHELDDMFRAMHEHFEGNESEHNWKLREQSVTKLRRLLAGNAADFQEQFLVGLRGLLDGIIKAVKSLRTSLSKEGCSLVQDIAFTFGPGMDPMVELLMQAFLQLAGATKKIASQSANVCVDAIMARVTFTKRLMEHVAAASRDKNVQPRLYATQWLKTMLLKEGKNKSHIEHIGGLDLIEQAIKKGLADANPGVREKMRATFWVFHGLWPARAEALMDTLEPTAQKLLEKDPNNPHAPKRTEQTGTARPGMGLSRSTLGTKPPSIRDTIKAQRAAISRPGSAMEPSRPRAGSAMDFSPPPNIRTASGASNASAPTVGPPTATRTKIGGLSGAPVRPRTRTGPSIPPRPKTAGPYDVRRGTEAGLASPPQLKKAVTPRTMVGSPKRTVVPRVRSGHQPTTSESSLPSPTRFGSPRSPTASPAPLTPMRSRLQAGPLLGGSPKASPTLESMTMPNIMDVAESQTPMIQSPLLIAPETSEPRVERQEELPAPALGTPASVGVAPQQSRQSSSADTALKVYEDPATDGQSTTRPAATTALGERPVNEDAAHLMPRQNGDAEAVMGDDVLPEKAKQQARLIDSALNKIRAKNLDVHGFRRFQSFIRDGKGPVGDEKFDALVLGLFEYLEDPQSSIAPEKVQDVKAQILATIKILLRKQRSNFQPHISKALESLMAARGAYDARTHIVSGLELLADELVTLGDAQELVAVLTKRMAGEDARNAAGCRSLTMGLHVLKEMVDKKEDFHPSDSEMGDLAALCMRCLESSESGVRMDAVQLCVALHARAGDARFWEAMTNVKDDPKSLITYYIVKRQRETASTIDGSGRA